MFRQRKKGKLAALWWLPFVYGALALALIWPAPRVLTTAVPQGSELTTTVPHFNVWTLGWNVNRIQHGFQGYWDAPIFYPVPGAFAFSEPQPLTGLLAAPFWWISPALAYNGVLLLFLMLNGVGACFLLQHQGVSTPAAFCGGLLVESLPFLANERGVLQLQPLFGLLWAMDGLWMLRSQRKWRYAWLFGLGMGFTFLTSEYYALFLGLVLATAVPFILPALRWKRVWLPAGFGVGLAALLILPVAVPQLRIIEDMGFSRSIETISKGSATLAEYAQVPHVLWSHSWLPLPDGSGQQLFPGGVLLGLAVIGGVFGVWFSRMRRWTLFLVAATAVTFLLSLGFNLHLGSWQPYSYLRDYMPGFENLRSPFRLAYMVQLCLALLVAPGIDWLWRQRRSLAVVFMGLALLEMWPLPAQLTTVPQAIDTAAITPPAVFLPFPKGLSTAAFADTAVWMAATMHDPVPLVNGYSGYFPRLNSQLKLLLVDFPTESGLAALRSLGVNSIVVRESRLSAAQQTRLAEFAAAGDLQAAGRQSDLLVFTLLETGLHPAEAYAGGWAFQTALTANDQIRLEGYAAVSGTTMYVLAPKVAPLQWRIHLTGKNGVDRWIEATPVNAVLFYHGSDRWVQLYLPQPDQPGTYRLTIQEQSSGRILGEQIVAVP